MSLLEQLAREIETAISGRSAGRIFQLGDTALAIDFIPHAGSYLFVDYGRRPQAFLIVRKRKNLERESIHLSLLAIEIKRSLSDRVVRMVTAVDGAIRVSLGDAADEIALEVNLRTGGIGLVVREHEGDIIFASRPEREATASPGTINLPEDIPDVVSISQTLDDRYGTEEAGKSFERLATSARRAIGRELAKAKRLLGNIEGDIRKHGDAEAWKKFGDLILANLATLRREGQVFILTDYFDEDASEIQVPADENRTPAEVAEEYFRRYTRARNAASQSAIRRLAAERTLAGLESRQQEIEAAIERRDEAFLLATSQSKQQAARATAPRSEKKSGKKQDIPQARRFISSAGSEILVGKKAVDNDHLTFRIAKSHDLWLHAADYPGSHVILRNHNKADVPQNVLLEAARLAAFYSDAREMPKAAVNYTQRKFVQKPKRAAPGMVSLSKFKTLLVEPGVPESVTKP